MAVAVAQYGRQVDLSLVPPTGPGVLVNPNPALPQIRIDFSVEKSIGGSAGQARIFVFNLGELARQIAAGIVRRTSQLDPLEAVAVEGISITPAVLEQLLGGGAGQEVATVSAGGGVVKLRAGFQGFGLPTIFDGSSQDADSYPRHPDWITEISASDGGLGPSLALASKDFTAGTPMPIVVDYLRKVMGLGAGTLLPAAAPVALSSSFLRRPWSALGQARELLESQLDLLEVDWWIDDGDLYLIGAGEALPGVPHRFSTDPLDETAITMYRSPELLVGDQVAAETQMAGHVRLGEQVLIVSTRLAGLYRVSALVHAGSNRRGRFASSWTLDPLGVL